MFPYVRRNLQTYLDQHWDEAQLQADVKLLRELSQEDAKNGVAVRYTSSASTSLRSVPAPQLLLFLLLLLCLCGDDGGRGQGVPVIPEEGDKATALGKVVKNVTWQMDQDRKSTALKGTHPPPRSSSTADLSDSVLLQLSRATCGRADSLLASSSASAYSFSVHFSWCIADVRLLMMCDIITTAVCMRT